MSKESNEKWYDPNGWQDASNHPYNPFVKEPEIPFYSSSYKPHTKPPPIKNPAYNLQNPVSIYHYLKKYIYKQDDYVKNLALFLYNHLNGRESVMLVTGPPGNGKTYAAEQLKKLYYGTILWDASTLSKDGWTGSNKIQDILAESLKYQNPIIVLDEFDKLCQPLYSHNSNISLAMQSEFLKLFEGNNVHYKSGNDSNLIDTKSFSWLLIGSFSEKANEIAESENNSNIGFLASNKEATPYSKTLCIKDLIDYGMISEIASRITKICHTNPLSCDDYYHLIKDHESSPIKSIEKQYGFSLNLSDKEIHGLSNQCFESELGIRSIKHKLICIADEMLFKQFENNVSKERSHLL